METNHKLALYVAYYLARFNDDGLENLGYKTWNDAFNDIGEKLKIKKNSIQNRRDEFDPLFEHRAGWYQRPMSPSRVKVVQALESLDEPQIRMIVQDIISGNVQNNDDELDQLIGIVSDDGKKKKGPNFILRGPTGRLAEEFFITHFSKYKIPFDGLLVDCRDLGVGYDFRIELKDGNCFVEVKGLSKLSGGVLFTNKEWEVAKLKKNRFYLCVVSNLENDPSINFIQNPFDKLNPKRNIYTTIQIAWSVSQKQLSELND